MTRLLVDTNVILDIFTDDPIWGDWSVATLAKYGESNILCINVVIYTELSIGFQRIEELEMAINQAEFEILPLPKEALFLAGKAFLQYRRHKGSKLSPLPDFFIGAQAAVMGLDVITRDISRFRTYFPTVRLITP